MTTLLIAFKLLWKSKLTNLTLVLQIVLSIIMLAQLFVFIVDHIDNMRAVSELPIKNTVVLSVFEYYTAEYATQQVLSSPQVDSVGRVYLSNLSYNNVPCNLAVYNDSIIARYLPELQSGSWFLDYLAGNDSTIPAVVSGDIGLKIGNTIDVRLPNDKTCRITVIGILKKPTQYLYPSGSASPEYFTANSVISQEPAVIIRDTDFGDISIFEPPLGRSITKNLFVFINPEAISTDVDAAVKAWNKYGETTPMISLISNYNKNTNRMIGGGTIMFIIFLSLAATSVLSNNVIQNLRNRRLFIVYYLLGMNWKKGAAIEICRVAVLISIIMMLSIVVGKFGLLMLQWMAPMRAYLFYGIVILYIVAMFAAVGAGFLIKLMREDISGSLKDLQQGE
jgi:hypothetical protein